MIPTLPPPALVFQAPGQGPEDQQLDPRPLLRFRAQRLKEGLGLSDAQADAMAKRWRDFDQEHFMRQRQIAALRLRFNDILMGPESEDRKSALIRPLLDQFMDLRRQQEEGRHRFEEDISSGLSPAQRARLILMVDELNRKIREALHERQMQPRGPGN